MDQEDAFKAIDLDFDGNINKTDLKQFLLNFVKIPPEQMTEPRIDRLFKLIDKFKRGYIQKDDINQIFETSITSPVTSPLSNQKTFFKTSKGFYSSPQSMRTSVPEQEAKNLTFDWMENAKQQIGLTLSKNFESIKTSFDSKKTLT